MQPMPSARRWKASHVLIAVIILGAGGYWLVQTVRRGSFSSDPANATAVVSCTPADGDRNVPVNAKITATVSAGRTVEKDTLNPDTVRLYRAADLRAVPGLMLASSDGDRITFTPSLALEPSTRYTFEIRGAKDSNEDDLLPYSISFSTAPAATTASD